MMKIRTSDDIGCGCFIWVVLIMIFTLAMTIVIRCTE
jgi:hypothetical protein